MAENKARLRNFFHNVFPDYKGNEKEFLISHLEFKERRYVSEGFIHKILKLNIC